MLQLGFSRLLASLFVPDANSDAQKQLTVAFVVLSIFAIDFSVNAVNALDRALLLDLVPLHCQSQANAWAARLMGIGAILGFWIGQTDLTQLVPFRWFSVFQQDITAGTDSTEAQLRCVCVFVVFLVIVTHIVTIAVAKETPLEEKGSVMNNAPSGYLRGLVFYAGSLIGDLYSTAKSLPAPIVDIFRIQFFQALAWYPCCEFRCADASLRH